MTNKKQKTKEEKNTVLTILVFIAFILLVIILTYLWNDYKYKLNSEKKIIINNNISKGYLYNLLQKEIVYNESWNCYDYMTYYNETLRKYNKGLDLPEKNLDIREIRKFDLCNGLTICDAYHTFLVIGGYGEECILDQTTLACIRLIDYDPEIVNYYYDLNNESNIYYRYDNDTTFYSQRIQGGNNE